MTTTEVPLSAIDKMRAWLTPDPVDVPAARVHPMPGQQLQMVTFATEYGKEVSHRYPTPSVAEANSISSVVLGSLYNGGDGRHKPILDIDLPCQLHESSTPGHHHLYIDKAMSWEDYELLLRALAYVGIIEDGYLQASLERRHTSVRLPWVRKDPAVGPTGECKREPF